MLTTTRAINTQTFIFHLLDIYLYHAFKIYRTNVVALQFMAFFLLHVEIALKREMIKKPTRKTD